jgi:hypothetical protein
VGKVDALGFWMLCDAASNLSHGLKQRPMGNELTSVIPKDLKLSIEQCRVRRDMFVDTLS